mgnify:CR=1 FL=1
MSFKPNRGADERTPLINGESSTDNGHVVQQPRSDVYAFFLDYHHTPGRDSDSLPIRSLAYTWHITKVTLLSSTLEQENCAPYKPTDGPQTMSTSSLSWCR